MKRRSTQLAIAVLCASSLAPIVAAQTCPGGPVAVNLISPAGSGTYKTPLHFQATATTTSPYVITGYAVYTNGPEPLGTGQPAYSNGISTLDAWVILPLTSSGGSLNQTVFVRAWNSNGDCNDSTHLSITASGTQLPSSYPSGYQRWLNRDDDQTKYSDGGGWNFCLTIGCAGGKKNATSGSITFPKTPSKDGNGSVLFTMTGPPTANALFWYKIDPVGQQDGMQNFVWDFYFQVSSNTQSDAQALEFDIFQALVVNGTRYEYMFGTQCDYAHAGGPTWQAWNASTGNWVDAIPNTATNGNPTGTPIPCSKYLPGSWHHAQFYVQRTRLDTNFPVGELLYGSVTVDGSTPTQWNIAAPANVAPSTWGDVLGFQHQLDINGSAPNPTTLQEWSDVEDFTAWPQD